MLSEAAPVLLLASASPRRRALLRQLGVAHVARGAHLDETVRAAETPRDYVARIAAAKVNALRGAQVSLPVLGADTVVVLDGVIYGKPRDRDDALGMLGRLSGRVHEVLTAVALADSRGTALAVNVSAVRFRTLSAQECCDYWASGEPRDKAGAYAIQGLAAAFIESLHGSYSGVMGLPLFETAALLHAAGVPYGRRLTS
jgi:septum formation protein